MFKYFIFLFLFISPLFSRTYYYSFHNNISSKFTNKDISDAFISAKNVFLPCNISFKEDNNFESNYSLYQLNQSPILALEEIKHRDIIIFGVPDEHYKYKEEKIFFDKNSDQRVFVINIHKIKNKEELSLSIAQIFFGVAHLYKHKDFNSDTDFLFNSLILNSKELNICKKGD